MRAFIFMAGVFLSFFSLEAGSFKKISDSPLVYACDNFLSDSECDHFIKIANPTLSRSTVIDVNSANNQIDQRRTSLGMFIFKGTEDKLTRKIQKRIEKAINIPQENAEGIQILYYDIDGEYQPHYDYFDPETSGGLVHYKRGGQRVATLILYLNTVKDGGETIFPKIGLKIAPTKGKALLFYNVTSDGRPDPMSFHGGAPVIDGEKWIITYWLREKPFY